MKNILTVLGLAVLFAAGIGFRQPMQSAVESKQPAKPAPPQPESIALIDSIDGAALYKAYCAVCHGPDGRGAGPMASALKVPPGDLTRIAARNRGVYPASRVERIISGEEALPSGHGTRVMPVWGPIFSQIAWDQDLGRLRVHNLAAYISRMQAR